MSRWGLFLFRLVLGGACAALVFSLLWTDLVPTGEMALTTTVGKPSPVFSRPLPDTRTEPVFVDAEGLSLQPLVGDPVYVTLHPIHDFDRVELEVAFQNDEQPIVEIGGLVNEEREQYDLRPLQNKIIDGLIDQKYWSTREDGDVLLLQRYPTYMTVQEFLDNPPAQEKVATYHYTLSRPFRIPGYRPTSAKTTIDASLRGAHEILTYVQNETLSFTFEYMDMNRTLGADPMDVLVFDQDNVLVASVHADDDGNEGSGGIGSLPRRLAVRDRLPDGVYKIILNVNRDIFFRRVETTQQKVVFLNQVFVGDDVGYKSSTRETTFYTDAKSLVFQTQHAEGVQNAVVGRSVVPVKEPWVDVRHRVEASGVVPVTLPVGDVLVRGAGRFAFSRDQYFNPDPVAMAYDTNIDALGIDYIIATYRPPKRRGSLWVARATFENAALARSARGSWKFAFSLPGVYDTGRAVYLHTMTANLSRQPLTLWEVGKRIWGKVRVNSKE